MTCVADDQFQCIHENNKTLPLECISQTQRCDGIVNCDKGKYVSVYEQFWVFPNFHKSQQKQDTVYKLRHLYQLLDLLAFEI